MIVAGAALAVLLPSTVAQADPTPTQIQAQIKISNNQLELIIESYDKINGDLATTQAALATLQAKLTPLQDSVDTAYSNVSQLAVTAYQSSSSMRTIAVLLSGNGSGDLMDQLQMLQQLSHQQSSQIKTYTDQKAGYDTEKNRLTQLLAQQNAQKADLDAKKAQIQGDLTKLAALQAKVGGNTGNSGGSSVALGPIPPVSGKAGAAVSYAYAHAQPSHHYMYHWGSAGPSEFDCSGFTMAAWASAGVSLPHNAASQYSKTRHISRSQLQPGDLVFYNGLGHVAIYVGNNTVIHAPHTGTWVQAAAINMDPISGYGRVVG